MILTVADLLHRIGNRKLEVSLLETFQQSSKALGPHDRATGSLKEVQPIFWGRYMIQYPNGIIRLDIGFDHGRRKTVRWCHMFPDEQEPTKMMEIILANLQG